MQSLVMGLAMSTVQTEKKSLQRKMAKMKNPRNSGIFRPYSSDNGPQIIGPMANPRTKREVPSVITSADTPNNFAVAMVAVLKTLLAKVIQIVRAESDAVIIHFFKSEKF